MLPAATGEGSTIPHGTAAVVLEFIALPHSAAHARRLLIVVPRLLACAWGRDRSGTLARSSPRPRCQATVMQGESATGAYGTLSHTQTQTRF